MISRVSVARLGSKLLRVAIGAGAVLTAVFLVLMAFLVAGGILRLLSWGMGDWAYIGLFVGLYLVVAFIGCWRRRGDGLAGRYLQYAWLIMSIFITPLLAAIILWFSTGFDAYRLAAATLPWMNRLSVPMIPGFLDDPNTRNNDSVIVAVINGAGPAATTLVPQLITRISDTEGADGDSGKKSDVAFRADIAIRAMGTAALPVLSEFLHDERPEVVARAAGLLADIGPPREAVEELVSLLGSSHEPAVRRQAVRALLMLNPEAAVGTRYAKFGYSDASRLREEFYDGKKEDLVGLGLGHNRHEVVDAFTDLFSSSNSERDPAIRALVALGPHADSAAAASALGELIESRDAMVSHRALLILCVLGPDAAPAIEHIRAYLRNRRGRQNLENAIDVLIAIGPGAKSAIPELLDILSEIPSRPRSRDDFYWAANDLAKEKAWTALERIGAPALPGLEAYIEDPLSLDSRTPEGRSGDCNDRLVHTDYGRCAEIDIDTRC